MKLNRKITDMQRDELLRIQREHVAMLRRMRETLERMDAASVRIDDKWIVWTN